MILTSIVQKSRISSDHLLAFLAVWREGNTLAAARRMGLDHSTVSRRIAQLEDSLSVRLFERSPRGLAPTAEAAALLPHAESIESELNHAVSSMATGTDAIGGTVRLATTEVFGTHVVAPALAELHSLHPDLRLELVPQARTISLSKREADLAITLHRPPRGRLVARKLVDYQLGLYASPAYLCAHPQIRSVEDLAAHAFVSYVDELVDDPEILALNRLKLGGRIVFRSSSSFAQHAAVTQGVGLGLLHRYSAATDPGLVAVLPDDIIARRTYWLVIHADLQRAPRVRAVADFLDQIIHARRADFSQG